MSIRRLARQSVGSNAATTNNWETEATEAYDGDNPGASPVSWGTDPEIANLDRAFDSTGSLKQHLGALLTLTAGNTPDLFWGAVVKLQVTYATDEDPQLELWTHDTVNGWVKRRKVDVPSKERTGEPVIFDLTLSTPLENVDKVWITLVPTGAETNNWVVLHLYGECNTDPLAIPNCPVFSNPADCTQDCDTEFEDWVCNPDDSKPPTVDFPFPPVIVRIPMPLTFTHQGTSPPTFPDPDPTQPLGGPTANSGLPPNSASVREMNYFNFSNTTASTNFQNNVSLVDAGAEIFAMSQRADGYHITDNGSFSFPPSSRRFSLIFFFTNMPIGSVIAMRSFRLSQFAANQWHQSTPNDPDMICDASDGTLNEIPSTMLSLGLFGQDQAFSGTGSGFRLFKVVDTGVNQIVVYTAWPSLGATPNNVDGWAFRFWLKSAGTAIPRVDILEGGYSP